MLPEVDSVPVDQGLVRVESGHERSPARTAQRILAISAIESDAPARELVDVWGFHLGMPITIQIAVQVIADDEKNVGFGIFLGLRKSGR